MTELSTEALIALLLLSAGSGILHGALGLGFPVVLTPVLALFFDVRTAVLLTLDGDACLKQGTVTLDVSFGLSAFLLVKLLDTGRQWLHGFVALCGAAQAYIWAVVIEGVGL